MTPTDYWVITLLAVVGVLGFLGWRFSPARVLNSAIRVMIADVARRHAEALAKLQAEHDASEEAK